MEPLQSSSTASQSSETFADEVQPDGCLRVVYKDTRQPADYFPFHAMGPKGWYWRNDEGGQRLIVSQKDDTRVEIPTIGILKVVVVGNSDEYIKWKDLENAAQHVIEVEHHLRTAAKKFDEKREAYLRGPVHSD